MEELNKNNFGHNSTKAKTARRNLKVAQLSVHDNHFDEDLKAVVSELQKKAFFLCDAERKFFAQKIKCDFLL